MITKTYEKAKTPGRRNAIVQTVFASLQLNGTTPTRSEISAACDIPKSSLGPLFAELEEDGRIRVAGDRPLAIKIFPTHPKNRGIIRDWRKHHVTDQLKMDLDPPFDTMCGDTPLDLTDDMLWRPEQGPEQPPLTEPMYTMRNAPTSALIYELVERGYVVSKGR